MSDSEASLTSSRLGNSVRVAGVIAMILVLAMMVYLADKIEVLESVEKRLAFDHQSDAETLDLTANNIQFAEAQTIYVPVYSHIYSDGGKANLLEVTLSIRNTDANAPIVVRRADYFDSKGVLVRPYIQQAVKLGPLESAEFLVAQGDSTGGVGANFIVEWKAQGIVYEPIVEAVMIGSRNSAPISFVSHGRTLVQPPESR